jgi:predicted RNase H-like HicB family nuclease
MEVSKMLYPVYVHLGDKQHAYGVTLPDFPGCFSAADSWEDLPAKIQEAVELHFEGEELEIHRPTPFNELAAQPEYQGGVWMMVDIDLARICPKAVRINISLPDLLVRRIDAYAKAHHMSRSGFLAKAAEEAMRE